MRFDRLMFPLLYKRNKNIYSSSILTIIFLMIISVIIIFFDTQNLIKSSVVRNKVLNIMFLSKDFFSSSLPNFLKLKEHFISKKQLNNTGPMNAQSAEVLHFFQTRERTPGRRPCPKYTSDKSTTLEGCP